MINHTFDALGLEAIAKEYAATPKQVEQATRRTMNRAAGTIRRLAGGLRTELALKNSKVLRRRIRAGKLGGRGNAHQIWVGRNDIPMSEFKGRPIQTPTGVQFGETFVHGGFIAPISGSRAVWIRGDDDRLRKATMPVGDRMASYLEDHVFVDVDAIIFRLFASEIRSRTVFGVGA